MAKNVEMDQDLLDEIMQGLSDGSDYEETPEEEAKRKAKLGIDASEDFSMDDFMSELDKFDPSAEEAGSGKAVKKRNWYHDATPAEKDSQFGDAPNELIDDSYLRNLNTVLPDSGSESDALLNSVGGESEDDSFRRRTAEAKKKYPNAGEKGLAKEKVAVKPLGKGGVEVEKSKAFGKARPLSNIPSEGDLFGAKRPERPAHTPAANTPPKGPAPVGKLKDKLAPNGMAEKFGQSYKVQRALKEAGIPDQKIQELLKNLGL